MFSELRSATNAGATRTGTISLEFYEKKKQRWPFNADLIPWEVSVEKVVNIVILQLKNFIDWLEKYFLVLERHS